jgi:Protein of unknown function DUF262/HNH endonuclease
MKNVNNNSHIRAINPKYMSQVNLDALIKRDDLFKMSEDETGFSIISEKKFLNIDADLTPNKSYFFKTLRKPDFQRETSEWKPERIVGLIRSFINGDIIPSLILWNWKGTNFIIDGGHRLSALVAWITDDYGDKEISEAYFGASNITKAQKKNAEATRKLVAQKIGTFKSFELAFLQEDKADSEIRQLAKNILVNRSIPVQWINANTSEDAEKSFFRINGEATPIDETEALILKSRNKPNAIASRAIIHGGNAHKYWKNFESNIQSQIEDIATKVNDLLFEPQLDEKTNHYPIAGKEYSKQSVELVFGIVNMLNNLDEINFNKKTIFKKDAKDIKPANDVDGNETLKYLSKVERIVSIICGEDARSLGLAPLVYFYSNKGKFQITSFLAIIHIIFEWDNYRSKPGVKSSKFQEFCAIRELFESFLLKNRAITTQATTNIGSGIKSYKRLADLYLFIIEQLKNKVTNEGIVSLIKQEDRFGFVKIFEAENKYEETRNPPGKGKIPSPTKNELVVDTYFNAKIICPICGGYYTYYSYNIDHLKERRNDGTNTKENLALGHRYCNAEKDDIISFKERFNVSSF